MRRARVAFSVLPLLLAAFLGSCEAPSSSPAPSQSRAQASAQMTGAPAAESRPGLGTGWGETRESRVRATDFRRASETRPLATAAIHYNDAAGIRAMTGAVAATRTEPVLSAPTGDLLSVELRDGNGRLLPGLTVRDRWFVVGEQGGRYVILLRNRSDYRMEVVLSVDGLDVLDGRPASFRKRGYVIPRMAESGWKDSGEARMRSRPFASARFAIPMRI